MEYEDKIFVIDSKYYKTFTINYHNSYPVYELELEIFDKIFIRPSIKIYIIKVKY